jgi:hypothetical protein
LRQNFRQTGVFVPRMAALSVGKVYTAHIRVRGKETPFLRLAIAQDYSSRPRRFYSLLSDWRQAFVYLLPELQRRLRKKVWQLGREACEEAVDKRLHTAPLRLSDHTVKVERA